MEARLYAHSMDLPLERSSQARLQGVQLFHGAQQNGGEDPGTQSGYLSGAQEGGCSASHTFADTNAQAQESTRTQSPRECAPATRTSAQGLDETTKFSQYWTNL